MKSVHNVNVTNENKKYMPVIGDRFHPITNYTKDDFLSPSKVAKLLGISTEDARKLMKKLEREGIKFGHNGHKKPMVSRAKPKSNTLFLHPMAVSFLPQYIK